MTENFRRISLESAPRTELHDALGLTGCEVSVNALPAGAAVPFVHRHVKNEEVYGILEGRGELYIDGEVVELKAGDWFRISPEGRRAIRAAADQGRLPAAAEAGGPAAVIAAVIPAVVAFYERRRRRLRRKGALALSPRKIHLRGRTSDVRNSTPVVPSAKTRPPAAVRARILISLRVRTAFFVFLPSSFCRLPFAPVPSAISRGRLFLA